MYNYLIPCTGHETPQFEIRAGHSFSWSQYFRWRLQHCMLWSTMICFSNIKLFITLLWKVFFMELINLYRTNIPFSVIDILSSGFFGEHEWQLHLAVFLRTFNLLMATGQFIDWKRERQGRIILSRIANKKVT